MILRAYHDPALRHPVSRDGSFSAPFELPCGVGSYREKRVYVHNPSSASIPIGLEIPATSGFSLIAPASIIATPGVSSFVLRSEVGTPAPVALDITIRGQVEEGGNDPGGAFADSSYSDVEGTVGSGEAVASTFRLEVTLFALPTADERFGDLGASPLRDASSLTAYLASGMGFVDDEYRELMVSFLADKLYDTTLWALNKHLLFNALHGPMRHAKARADSIGYDPPGVPAMPPIIRRRVYGRAFQLARATGSAEGIYGIFQAVGVPTAQLDVWREDFTWYVRIPQWVAAVFSLDLLGNLALYQVDAYCDINIAVNQDTTGNTYSDFDYAVEPTPAFAGGALLLEDGISFLLLEDGTKLILEG